MGLHCENCQKKIIRRMKCERKTLLVTRKLTFCKPIYAFLGSIMLLAVICLFWLRFMLANPEPIEKVNFLGRKVPASPTWDLKPLKLIGNEDDVRGLIVRLLGDQYASRFRIEITGELKENREWFNVSRRSFSDPVTITGSSGTAVSYGLHHYLKYELNCHVSWDGVQLDLPPFENMPVAEYEFSIPDRFRYYMNVCTFSYSYVWWNWTRWEREIDWMALNGFNLVLAFTGTEAVWKEVYLQLGLTQDEIDDHFSGPAFLAWNRMGNIRGGAKLSDAWHMSQVSLQQKILQRMRSLGITPVLPAFAGHLPRAITRIFPHAKITYAARWNNFPDKYCCPALLLPSDPLFQRIGSMFMQKLNEMFGTDHMYNCDPFNEMLPNTTDLRVLNGYGKSIYSSMSAVDPEAVWMLQGWFLVNENYYWTYERAKAFLTAVPPGKMIVLDLQSELKPQFKKFDNFFGQPFIWCMLHNFGRTLGLQGALEQVKQGILEGRKEDEMVGIGITMEGIETNYVVYDFFSEFVRDDELDIVRFSEDYSKRRYGEHNSAAESAWRALVTSVYNYTGDEANHGQYVFNNRPSLKKKLKYWYTPEDVYNAWYLILKAAQDLKSPNNLFHVDVVDITRQGIQLILDDLYLNSTAAYLQKDLQTLKVVASKFLDVLDDLESILGSNERFMLGPWLESAKTSASTPLEKKVYERDARNQISLWGPNGEIRDYANKQWSGVVKDYFKPRWELYFKALKRAVRTGSPLNTSKYHKDLFDIEQRFATSYDLYPTVPAGNPIQISEEIFQKLNPLKTTRTP
ncbi:hypothetical protein GE061_005138 [Apolygus lucorum]|uniref:Uncharacterized protein n=1 Tax=Apolygus lucorum TaxID=248454 RepID=A0A6A4J1A6_APOLU|nr:hypothetical protein GE061_005138 [Apolygus lucorum]